jgi:hypothetical protein
VSLYVTVAEYKQAPTAIELDQLDQTNLGNPDAQDAALLNILRRASSWVDNIVKMNTLEATVTTETKEVHIGKDGRIIVHPDNVPILNLVSVEYSLSPLIGFSTIPLDMIQTYENWFTIYQFSQNTLSPNLILQPSSLGYINPFTRQLLSDLSITLKYSYINGYMNTMLAQDANAGDTTIIVKDATGAYPGLKFTLYDAAYEEYCVISSVSGNRITLVNPLLFAHSSGMNVSCLPASVKQATILLANFLIKEKGSLAVQMNSMAVSGTSMDYNKPSDVTTAKELLRPFVRTVVSG